jgi:hypothetical protein
MPKRYGASGAALASGRRGPVPAGLGAGYQQFNGLKKFNTSSPEYNCRTDLPCVSIDSIPTARLRCLRINKLDLVGTKVVRGSMVKFCGGFCVDLVVAASSLLLLLLLLAAL